jgi:hypothetical protein
LLPFKHAGTLLLLNRIEFHLFLRERSKLIKLKSTHLSIYLYLSISPSLYLSLSSPSLHKKRNRFITNDTKKVSCSSLYLPFHKWMMIIWNGRNNNNIRIKLLFQLNIDLRFHFSIFYLVLLIWCFCYKNTEGWRIR